MTPQEALHEISVMVYRNTDNFEMRISKDCYKGLVNALEKQIPKKPNIHGYREGREINTISYTCPVCNKHIGRDAYCKHCGTALDWSDTNDTVITG